MLNKSDGIGGAGLLMVILGGALFMGREVVAPVWVSFLIGPLLWYAGFALMIVWMIMRWVGGATPEKTEVATTQTVIKPVRKPTQFSEAPRGVLREIPAMGGFIL